MGLYLSFYLNCSEVDAKLWEKVYFECLDWLNKFPLPLSRLKKLGKGKSKRYAHSSDIVKGKGTKEECWQINGDLMSGRYADDFTMNRHLDVFLLEDTYDISVYAGKSVFYADRIAVEDPEAQYGVNIWSEFPFRTQGRPYHLALVALGIWLEQVFPGKGYLMGDFDQKQVDKVIAWMYEHTGVELMNPILLDIGRLWHTIEAGFPIKKHAVLRFLTLWKGTEDEAYRFLIELGHEDVLMDVLAEKLSKISSLSRLQAITIWEAFLAATDNVDSLLDLVARANDKKGFRFDYADFLKQLCREYITLNPMEKKHLDFMHPESEDMQTVDDQFFDAFKNLVGFRKHNTKVVHS